MGIVQEATQTNVQQDASEQQRQQTARQERVQENAQANQAQEAETANQTPQQEQRQSPQQVAQQNERVARSAAEEVQKHATKEALDRVDNAQLVDLYKKLRAYESREVSFGDPAFTAHYQEVLEQEIHPALRRVEGQLKERQITQDYVEPLEQQLVKQWAKSYAGEKIKIRFANVQSVEKHVDPRSGEETYVVPANTSLEQFIQTAKLIAPQEQQQRTRLEAFAQNLQDTAVYLAQQRKQISIKADGTPVVNSLEEVATIQEQPMIQDEVIVALYRKGQQLKEMAGVATNEEQQPLTRAAIEAKEIVPEYYRNRYKDAVPEDVKQTAEYQRVQQLNEDRLLMFVMGKNVPTDPAGAESFYTRWYERIMAHGGKVPAAKGEVKEIHSEVEFRQWLGENHEQVMRRLAPFINKTKISEQTKSQQHTAEAVEQAEQILAKETVYEAISQRGRQEQTKATLYKQPEQQHEEALDDEQRQAQQDVSGFSETMTFSSATGQEMTRIAELALPPSAVNEAVAKKLAELGEDAPLQKKLEALNQAVQETYRVPTATELAHFTLQNYEPLLALREGYFSCVIRSQVIQRLAKEHFGDTFVYLGGSEYKHSSLVFVDQASLEDGKTPTGYYISTGGQEGYMVVELNDNTLEKPFMKPLVDAIQQDGDDVMIALELRPKDEILQVRMGGHITVGNVDRVQEAHVWDNIASARPNQAEEGFSPDFQLGAAKRAAIVNPLDVNAQARIVKLTHDMPGQEALYNTALRKAELLDPENATEEKILAEENQTVNAYPAAPVGIDESFGAIPFTDPQVIALADRIRRDQQGLSVTRADYLDYRTLDSFIRQAELIPPGTPGRDEILDQLRDAHQLAIRIDGMKAPLTLLTPEDFQKLVEDPDNWFVDKSNYYSNFIDKLKDINSPLLDDFNKEAQDALKFMARFHNVNPEIADSMKTALDDRKNARFMHLMIRLQVADKIPGQAQQLGFEGITRGMAQDKGRVGTAMNKLSVRLETLRMNKSTVDLLQGEDAKFLTNQVIDEELELAAKGLGEYAYDYVSVRNEVLASPGGRYKSYYEKYNRLGLSPINAAEAIAKDITTAKLKNTFGHARDLLYCSQRFFTIADRGYAKKEQFKKQPAELFLQSDNFVQYEEKWANLTPQERRKLALMELDATEREMRRAYVLDPVRMRFVSRRDDITAYNEGEKVLMGEPLLNRTLNSGELFAGGWRIPEMIKALNERLGEEVASHLQLFLKLKTGTGRYSDMDEQALERLGYRFPPESEVSGAIRDEMISSAKAQLNRMELLRGDIADYYGEVIVGEFRNKRIRWDDPRDGSYGAERRQRFINEYGNQAYLEMKARDDARFQLFEDTMNLMNRANRRAGYTDFTVGYTAQDDRTQGQYIYDQFRVKYDTVMSTIRQISLSQNPPMQVDFTNLSAVILEVPDATGAMVRTTGEAIVRDFFTTGTHNGADEVIELQNFMGRMQRFTSDDNTIQTLLYDLNFNDTFHKVLRTDDIRADLYDQNKRLKRNASGNLLDRSNRVILIDPATGRPIDPIQINQAEWETVADLKVLPPVSAIFAADPAGDALERIWKDKLQGAQQAAGTDKFLETHPSNPEQFKVMKEAATAKKAIDGKPGYVESMEPMLGAVLRGTEIPEWAKTLGVKQLPRFLTAVGITPLSEFEQSYGPDASGMSPEEQLGLLDELRAELATTAEYRELAERTYSEFRAMLAIEPNDLLRRRLLSTGIFLLLAMIAISINSGMDMVKEQGAA